MMYVTAYRSMERPQLGLYILMVSMTLNTFLNWVFIFGNLGAPALGVRGAALATLIARSAELVIVVVHLLTTKFFRVQPALVLLPAWICSNDLSAMAARWCATRPCGDWAPLCSPR